MAENQCKSEGGHLMSVHNIKQNYFALSLFTAILGLLDYRYFWVGGVYNPDNKSIQWTDGSPMDIDFWRKRQPDANPKKKCLDMVPKTPSDDDNGSWSSWYCDAKKSYVCERRVIMPNSDSAPMDGKTKWVIAGVVCALVLIAVLVGGIFLYKRSHTGKRQSNESDDMDISDPFMTLKQKNVSIVNINQELSESPMLSPRSEDIPNNGNLSSRVGDL
eukprot:Tbor_TRINITY_DN5931_c0_g1::TRINITY_DN5931_c0_g1_i4::g.19341::m.19341